MKNDTIFTFAGFTCKVELHQYANGGTCIRLVDPVDHGPVATATSWIPGLHDGELAIKDYSENTGMLMALLNVGVITIPHRLQDGFPVVYLTKEKEEEDTAEKRHREHKSMTAIEVEDREHKRQVICPECGEIIHELEPSWYEDFESGERRESHVWMPTSRCCSEPCGQSEYCVSYTTFYGQPCYS